MVFVNEGVTDQEFLLESADDYQSMKIYVTSDEYDLECTQDGVYRAEDTIIIPKRSVTTVVLTQD